MNTTGFWAIGGLAKSKIEWDIAPLWKGKQQAVTAFGSGLAVSRTAKNPDAALKAIDFFTSPEAQQQIIATGQDVPASLEVRAADADSLGDASIVPRYRARIASLRALASEAPRP